MKNKAKRQGKGKCKILKCHKCGGPNHFARKCRTPQYLIELYQKSLKETNDVKRLYEAHLNDVSTDDGQRGHGLGEHNRRIQFE
jgi:hypothetical protein